MLRAVHDHARQHRRQRRAAVDPEGPGRFDLRPRVDDERLHPLLRRRPRDRRAPRRHLRPPTRLPDRCGHFRHLLGYRRPRPRPDRARRQPRRPGHRSRTDDAGHPLDHHQRLPAHERGKAMGTWAGVSALALAIGPVLGGLLTEHVSWRAIFYLNIPVAIGAVAATLFAVPRVARHERRQGGRLPRRRDPDHRPHRAGPRSRRGQQLGLGLDPDRRPAGRLDRRPCVLRLRRAARQGPDGPIRAALAPQLTWAPRSSP